MNSRFDMFSNIHEQHRRRIEVSNEQHRRRIQQDLREKMRIEREEQRRIDREQRRIERNEIESRFESIEKKITVEETQNNANARMEAKNYVEEDKKKRQCYNRSEVFKHSIIVSSIERSIIFRYKENDYNTIDKD